MSKEDSDRSKFFDKLKVDNRFVDRYYRSGKGQRELAALLNGLEVVTSIEQDLESSTQLVVVIEADNQESVQKAKMKLSQALLALTTRFSFTHLVTFPFTDRAFVSSFSRFKEQVLDQYSHCRGIDESLFQNPKKLHLTVSVLTLPSEENVAAATEIFQNECAAILESEIDILRTIQVKGLGTMNDDPSRTNVLYAKIEDCRLQEVADRIARRMHSAGFVLNDNNYGESVKLHVTLMNTTFSRRKARKKRQRKLPFKNFDCLDILEHYKEFVFADIEIPSIQLNDVRSESEEGYYHVVHSVALIKPFNERQ